MDTWIAEYTAETGRSVSAELHRDLDVDAGERETVTVRCDNGTQTDDATAEFTATDVGGCNSELGTFSDAGTTVSGTISSDDGCTSMRRSSGTYHARRHILALRLLLG